MNAGETGYAIRRGPRARAFGGPEAAHQQFGPRRRLVLLVRPPYMVAETGGDGPSEVTEFLVEVSISKSQRERRSPKVRGREAGRVERLQTKLADEGHLIPAVEMATKTDDGVAARRPVPSRELYSARRSPPRSCRSPDWLRVHGDRRLQPHPNDPARGKRRWKTRPP